MASVPTRKLSFVRIVGALAVTVGMAAALSGCSASVNTTVPAESVADLAATALGDQWDTDPTVDCGDGSVDAVVGTTVDCTVFNPKSALNYPATVTLTEVEGSTISISVETG